MLYNTPDYITRIFPDYTFHKSREEKKIYISFDDGPIPGVTPWVMETLNSFNAKASFFCVGENLVRNHLLAQELTSQGHTIGNHTHDHLNGWKTPLGDYLENFRLFEKNHPTHLFRPPYGKIYGWQRREISKTHELIMWDVLSGDYNSSFNGDDCLNICKKHTRNGSIVVFHDSLKAEKNLKYTLPRFLEFAQSEGYEFAAL